MQLFEALELAAAALTHSAPTANYAEAKERHAKARRAIREAMEVMEEQHNFQVMPEPAEI